MHRIRPNKRLIRITARPAPDELIAVRSACAEKLGRPVDWDAPASYRDGPEWEYAQAAAEPWTVGGALAGVGCLMGTLAFLAIWVCGVVALFD
ncbi:DUF6584 family protein [Streptomyces sp. NPDC051987]|uniref:DUF6584 family protein n=1 Tax=Streptomyces sp. NPDC051987 TaxID=3155808 RepID=UPI003437DDA4